MEKYRTDAIGLCVGLAFLVVGAYTTTILTAIGTAVVIVEMVLLARVWARTH